MTSGHSSRTRAPGRALALLFCLLCLLPNRAGAVEKLTSLPKIFKMDVLIQQREEGKNERFIQREVLRTRSKAVNAAMLAAVDALDKQMSPMVQTDPQKNARNNSRLDIETTYTKTGTSWVSALITARVTWKREQTALAFTALVYDLKTGKPVLITDLFPEDSPAWALLQGRVKDTLGRVYPGQERDPARLEALCSQEALSTAAFTLSGGELTLHYLAQDLGLPRPAMVHVRFFYPELSGMWSEAASQQTDNRQWKMVALTFDDGPRYFNTVRTLDQLRQAGARATFFTSGSLYKEGKGILRRQYDGNHLIGTHSFNHWSGYTLTAAGMQKELRQVNDFLLDWIGEEAHYFRAPGGLWPPWQEKKIGLPIIQWSVDTYDYKAQSEQSILRIVRQHARHGDILLLHDTRGYTYSAIPLIASYLDSKGFLMVTIEELAWMEGVHMEPNIVYARFLDGQYDERKDSNLN